jgi:photosystem II stability/assembly factor-like uncharacterized protein
VFSGFRNGEDAAHVFKTTNGGATWENLSGNLPNAPVNDIVVDSERGTVFVGTDVGVFHLKAGGRNWAFVGKRGLPLAPVLDIRLHSPSGTLYVSTFGRSTWKISLEDYRPRAETLREGGPSGPPSLLQGRTASDQSERELSPYLSSVG